MHWYRSLLKPILFRQDPEEVHERAIRLGKFAGKHPALRRLLRRLWGYQHDILRQEIDGVTFQSPIGLSAGFDKNGDVVDILPSIGLGFAQVGTITHGAYGGNPKPRVTRLPRSRGILVNYGLKNIGARAILAKLSERRVRDFPLSISIGKTNCAETATCDTGIADQIECLREVIDSGEGDWYTLNISCPNTFGGEPFTDPESLDKLLQSWFLEQPPKPTYLKMPINLPWEDFSQLLAVADRHGVRGVIIGNLNKNHADKLVQDPIAPDAKGGVSGVPTRILSNTLIQKTYHAYPGRFVIVGVGGVFTAHDAYEKIRLGADLVQLITGLIYRGPGVVQDINRGLVQLLRRDGFVSVAEAVGSGHQDDDPGKTTA